MSLSTLNPEAGYPSVVAASRAIFEAGDEARRLRKLRKADRPLVRLWDGDWNLRGRVTGEVSGSVGWVSNNSGTGTIMLPADHYLAKWIARPSARKKNVHLTVDKDGARWPGRLTKFNYRKDESGARVLVCEFVHLYENLKHLLVWSNPVLPAEIQFPRVFLLAGPAAWGLKLAGFLNCMRNFNSLFSLPDDPLDFSQWTGNLDMRNWPMTFKGGSYFLDGTPHAVINSRFKTWHELAEPILNDAQLEVTTEVWLTGDPDPWPGYTPRNGQVIYDIVDKSGWWGQTGTGGNVLTGIVRTLMELDPFNNVDETRSVVANPNTPSEYLNPDKLVGTHRSAPWVLYREGDRTGIESSDFSWQPATATRVVVGGRSMPGTNELISVAIQAAGDIASAVFGGVIGNVGQMADTLLKPIYSDTILAWQQFKSTQRAQDLGWSYFPEHLGSGSDRAYTLSALMAIRRAWWDTRERVSNRLSVADAAPYMIGQNGHGHFFLGDRIAFENPLSEDGSLVVERVSELTFAWDRLSFGWSIGLGDYQAEQSGLDRAVEKVGSLASAAKDLGVL